LSMGIYLEGLSQANILILAPKKRGDVSRLFDGKEPNSQSNEISRFENSWVP